MSLTSIAELSAGKKSELLASLAVLVIADSGGDITAESLTAVVAASGNSLPAVWASIFAASASKGIDAWCGAPGGGGGGAAPAAGAAPVAAKVVEEAPKEEEMDLSGGMDMFGGAAAGAKGDY